MIDGTGAGECSGVCSVRQCGPGDEAGVLNLLNGVDIQGDKLLYRFESLSGLKVTYPNIAIWVADLNGEIVGTTTGVIKDVYIRGARSRIGHIFNLRIAADVRRAGVANLLSGANKQWMSDNAVGTHMCLVGAENAASLGFVTSVGYREASRVKYLRVQRQNFADRPRATLSVLDLNRSPALRSHVEDRFCDLDLCPVDLIEDLYRRAGQHYLGTLYGETANGTVFGSVFDKNAALGKKSLAAASRTLFMYDISAQSADDIEMLVSGAFANSDADRLVLVLNQYSGEGAAAEECRMKHSLAAYTECIMTRGLSVSVNVYVDVRD